MELPISNFKHLDLKNINIVLTNHSSLIAQLVKNQPAMQETLVHFLGQEDLLEKGWAPNPLFLGFPCGSAGKDSACNVEDVGLIPGLGRSPGEGKGYPLQYSGLENSMDRGACQATVQGLTKSQKRLSNFHCFQNIFKRWHE